MTAARSGLFLSLAGVKVACSSRKASPPVLRTGAAQVCGPGRTFLVSARSDGRYRGRDPARGRRGFRSGHLLPRAAGERVRSSRTMTLGVSRCGSAVALSLLLLPLAARAQQTQRPDRYVLTLGETTRAGTTGQPKTEPDPSIYIRTVDDYPCLLRLPIESRTEGRRIRVRVGDLWPGAHACFAQIGPATGLAVMQLGNGVYRLDLVNDGRTDHYTLIRTDSTLSVHPARGTFSSFTNTTFRRTGMRN